MVNFTMPCNGGEKSVHCSISMTQTRGWGGGGGGGGGETPPMKGVRMLVVSLRGINFGFWSHLGCSGQNAITFSREGLV